MSFRAAIAPPLLMGREGSTSGEPSGRLGPTRLGVGINIRSHRGINIAEVSRKLRHCDGDECQEKEIGGRCRRMGEQAAEYSRFVVPRRSLQPLQKEKALSDFGKAIEVKPDHADAYLKRAIVYEERGESEKALADLARVTEIDPAGHTGFLHRAILYERIGNVDLALADYEKLLGFAPNEQFYRSRRDALLQKKGVTVAPAISPPPKVTIPLTTAPAVPEGRPPVVAASPLDCKVFVPAANLTVSIPCAQ